MNDLGFVYFIHSYGTNLFKIGKANQPKDRLKHFQTGNHGNLYLYATIETKTKSVLERQALDFFKPYLVKGEWFEIPNHNQSMFSHFASEENHRIEFHNFVLHPQMVCGWHGLQIISETILHIFLLKGDCSDMWGCISFAESILPDVELIQTFSGDLPDFRYVKTGKDWAAQIH
jgi:hypothetical protein